ncbi:hypothetical protein OVA26_17170 [Microbacterium sp. SL62]|uniref:hypothetical protein n=1 Tax=Microbacterium sp. SL62 TaxID=2995139 RepID=UPI00227330F7|nr:hypothetical protein [Microbacterium sp. SL62]MCY1718670.1 hypothetical protein [Microbacterium sp. SL62]
MPRLTGAPEAMPERAERAQRAISTMTRVKVLRYLAHRPEATRQDILDATDLSYATLRDALEDLGSLGYVAKGKGSRSATYSVDRAKVTEDLALLVAFVLG